MIRHISPGRARLFVSESESEFEFELELVFEFVFEGEVRVRSAALSRNSVPWPTSFVRPFIGLPSWALLKRPVVPEATDWRSVVLAKE
jgi:hypothetical protein